jgi:hypothetical protein
MDDSEIVEGRSPEEPHDPDGAAVGEGGAELSSVEVVEAEAEAEAEPVPQDAENAEDAEDAAGETDVVDADVSVDEAPESGSVPEAQAESAEGGAPETAETPAAPEATETPEVALAPEAEATLAALTSAVPGGAPEAADRAPRVWIPFLVYFVAWLVYGGVDFYLLLDGAKARDIVADAEYPVLLYSALGLAGLGVILVPIVWLLARRKAAPGRRKGLLARSLLLGGTTTFLGVAIWWLVLYLLDMVAAGRLHVG